jgi:hypothetical protein
LSKIIVTLGTVVLVGILFCVGSYLVYVGAWNYVLGSKYGLFFGPPIALWGGGATFVGIIIALHMRKVRRKWIIALGAASLYVALFFLYFGLYAYFFPRFPGEIHSGILGIRFGSFLTVIGVVLLLTEFVLRKMKVEI